MAHINRIFKVLSVQNSACAEDWSKRIREKASMFSVIYWNFSAGGKKLFSADD